MARKYEHEYKIQVVKLTKVNDNTKAVKIRVPLSNDPYMAECS